MPEATLTAPGVLDVVQRDTCPIVRPRTWPLAGSLGVLLVVLFGAWSARFIWGSSFIAIDGQRHFSLFDDAIVSLRYAWNLAHGAGLVWNPGEYVEGYTNLLMTLLMTLVVRIFGRDFSPLAVQAFGVFTVLGCAALAVKVSDQLADHESAAIANVRRFVVGASVLMLYPLVYWSEMGMETGLLTLLLLASFATAFSASRPQWLIVLAVLLGLAYLTRPDSAIFAALILGYASFELLRRDWRSRQRLWLIAAAGLLLLAFPVTETVFRWFYYGELVPNTYTLKVAGIPLLVRLTNGWIYVRNFLPSVAPMLLLGGIGSLAGLRLRRLVLGAVVLTAGATRHMSAATCGRTGAC